MNGANKRVEHIDPRIPKKRRAEKDKELKELAESLRKTSSNPYRYIRKAFECFGKGDLVKSYHWVNYAADIADYFYPAGSLEADIFRKEVNLIRFTIIFLDDKFRMLPPETD